MSVETNLAIASVLHCYGLWLTKKSRATFSTNQKQTKTNVTCSDAFSRAGAAITVFALGSDWFVGLSASVVIGQSNWFSDTHLKTDLY